MKDDATIEKLKLEFVEHLKSKECYGILYLAAGKVNRTYVTIWTWMQEDPLFKERVLEAQQIGDELANDATEEALMKRIEAGSDRLIEFRLLNRKKAKYGKSGKESTTTIHNIVKNDKALNGLSKAVSKFLEIHATRVNQANTTTDTDKATE